MKKVKNVFIWVSLIVYLVVAFSFAASKSDELVCSNINVIITDSLENNFVSEDDVVALMKRNEMEIMGYHLNSINTNVLEGVLNEKTVIRHAEVFKTVDGSINVKIKQRRPIVRVYNRYGHSFYIDQLGSTMPLSRKFTSHVLIVSGHIDQKIDGLKDVSLNCSKLIDKQSENILFDIFQIANFIQKSPFWEAQIEQVYVNSNGGFELIPRVGAHVIEFGDASELEYKFKKLKALYEKGFPLKGWNNYNRINLKYSNQVICTKKIG